MEQLNVGFAIAVLNNLVDHFNSTRRSDPARMHLPHDSFAQNSMANRAMRAISTVSSNATIPPWPSSARIAVNDS